MSSEKWQTSTITSSHSTRQSNSTASSPSSTFNVASPSRQSPSVTKPPTPPQPPLTPLSKFSQSIAKPLLRGLPNIPRHLQPMVAEIRPSTVPTDVHVYLAQLEQKNLSSNEILLQTQGFLGHLNEELADHLKIYENTIRDLLQEVHNLRIRCQSLDVLKQMETEIASLQDANARISRENKVLVEENVKLKAELQKSKDKNHKDSEELNRLNGKIHTLQVELNVSKGLSAELRSVKQSLHEEQESRQQLTDEMNTLKEEYSLLKQRHEKTQESLRFTEQERNEQRSKYNQQLQENKKLKKEIQNLHQQLSQQEINEANLSAANDRIASLETSLKQHTEDLNFAKDILQKGQNDLQKSREDNQKLRVDLERSNGDNKKLRDIIADMQGKVVVVQGKEVEIAPFKNLIASEAEKMRRLLNPTEVSSHLLFQSEQTVQVSEKRTHESSIEEEGRKVKRSKKDNQ